MNDKKYFVVYFASPEEMDGEVKSLLEKQAMLLIAKTLSEVETAVHEHDGQVALLVVDLRGEKEDGNEKLTGIQKNTVLKLIPAITVCGHNAIPQFTVAMKHELEVIDLPVNHDAFIRRCNRACKMTEIPAKK